MRTAWPLVTTWLGLIALLAGTIGASFVFTGLIGLAISLAIATLKSSLIYWRFMHLSEAPPLSRVAAVAAAAWILILLVFICADQLTRGL